MMRRTRLEWLEPVAGVGMWIAIGASAYLAVTRPERMWGLAGCVMALAVFSAVAGIPRRLAGRRLRLRKGGEAARNTALEDRGRDDDRPADVAVHRRPH